MPPFAVRTARHSWQCLAILIVGVFAALAVPFTSSALCRRWN